MNSENVSDKYMQDAQGRLVPVSMVSDIDCLLDETVKEVVAGAEDIAAKLLAYKRQVLYTIQAFVETSAEQFRVILGGKKGNVTLTSFDGEYKVIRAISEHIAFDERL